MSPAYTRGVKDHLAMRRSCSTNFTSSASERGGGGSAAQRDAPGRASTAAPGEDLLLWRKNPEGWTEQEAARWEQLKDKPLVTGLAYAMRLELQKAYAAGNAAVARSRFIHWCQWVRTEAQALASGLLAPIEQGGRHGGATFGRHSRALERRFDHGVLEGLNSLFSATKRKARGYRSTVYQIAMLYFVAGKLEIPSMADTHYKRRRSTNSFRLGRTRGLRQRHRNIGGQELQAMGGTYVGGNVKGIDGTLGVGPGNALVSFKARDRSDKDLLKAIKSDMLGLLISTPATIREQITTGLHGSYRPGRPVEECSLSAYHKRKRVTSSLRNSFRNFSKRPRKPRLFPIVRAVRFWTEGRDKNMALTIFIKSDRSVAIVRWFLETNGNVDFASGPVVQMAFSDFRADGYKWIHHHFSEYLRLRLSRDQLVKVFQSERPSG